MKEVKVLDLEKSLDMLEEIVLTGETIEFYRKEKCDKGLEKELDRLKEQIKEWRDRVKEK